MIISAFVSCSSPQMKAQCEPCDDLTIIVNNHTIIRPLFAQFSWFFLQPCVLEALKELPRKCHVAFHNYWSFWLALWRQWHSQWFEDLCQKFHSLQMTEDLITFWEIHYTCQYKIPGLFFFSLSPISPQVLFFISTHHIPSFSVTV